MDWNTRVRQAFAERTAPDDDIVEELAQHAAAAFEAARADGCDAPEAERRVQAQVAAWVGAGPALARRPRRSPAIDPPSQASSAWAGVGRDLRYAVQTIRRQPAMAALVALTLALGVGATTVLVSVAYGVLLKPLPFPDADRLVRLTETRGGSVKKPVFFTNATYLAWAEKPRTIDALGAWSASPATFAGAGDTERLRVVEVTPGLLPMLGVRPVLGRLFSAAADGRADTSQVVLSYQLWQRKFGGSPSVVGRPVQIDGEPRRITGVAPAGFGFPDAEAQAYVPFNVPPVGGKDGQGGMLSMFGAVARLKPGATAAQAAAEATARGRAAPDPGMVIMAVFGSRGPVQVLAVPWIDSVVGEIRPALIVFLAAVGLLLAVATANVASLQLARAAARRREFAIRSALGAGAGRLTRQLLVENLLIGQVGGLGGLLLAAVLLRILPAFAAKDFPRMGDVALDWRAALASIGLSLLASLAFGLAPVLQARRLDVAAALAEDGIAPVGGYARSRTGRARLVIMTGQIAAAAVLLVGAVLLGRSFLALMHADRGYDPSNVLTAVVTMPDSAFSPRRRGEVVDRLVERLRALPGVTAAAYSSRIPLVPLGETLAAFPVPARGGGGTVPAHATLRFVSAGFIEALGIPVREGRSFRDSDAGDSQAVVMVNRAFAREYLDAPAVGKRLPDGKAGREIIGVIDDIRYAAAADAAQPELYECGRQAAEGWSYEDVALVVRTSGPPSGIASSLRALVRQQDAAAALGPVMTMEDRVWASLARPRFYALLLGGFAAFAVAVAGVGLFGVLSYSVSLRAREIGIRTTLGATPARIVGLVAGQALAVAAGGLAVGLAAAAALGKWIAGLLFGVTPGDAATFATVAAVLASVAVLACAAPARHAARVDPVKVLK